MLYMHEEFHKLYATVSVCFDDSDAKTLTVATLISYFFFVAIFEFIHVHYCSTIDLSSNVI